MHILQNVQNVVCFHFQSDKPPSAEDKFSLQIT
jgi:hypothetical protein